MDAISMVAGGLFLAATAFGDDPAKSATSATGTTKVVTRVVKGGHSSEGELKRLGVDLAGLDALVADAVKRAVDDVAAGRTPDPAAIERHGTLNGVPVEAHVEVKTGAEALEEFERRFPELKGELDELQRSFGDPPCGRGGREPPAPKPASRPAPQSGTGPAARPAPVPVTGHPLKPVARPAAKAAPRPSVKLPAKPAAAPLADPAVKLLRDSD